MIKRTFSGVAVAAFLVLSSTIVAECVTTDDSVWSMENDYLKLNVEQDYNEGEYLRFNLETVVGDKNNIADNEKSLLYTNFFSGYTTIHYDGQTFMYGRGSDITEPYYNDETKEYISNQKLGELSVEQKLSFCKVFTEEYDDMLKVEYSVTNLGESNSLMGLRVLIDPMLGNDDKCQVEINNVSFINEACFYSENIPQIWSVKSADGNITAFGKIDKSVDNPVDSLAFANWNSLYDRRWDYTVNTSAVNNDCAIAFSWDDEEIKSGETKEYIAYYGVKNTAKTEPITEKITQEATDSTSIKQNVIEGQSNQTTTEKITTTNTVSSSEENSIDDKGGVIITGGVIPVALLIALLTSALGVIFFRRRVKDSEKTK